MLARTVPLFPAAAMPMTFRRVPLAGERQHDRERRSRRPKHQADGKQRADARRRKPRERQGDEEKHEQRQCDASTAKSIAQYAEGHAEKGAGQDGNANEQPLQASLHLCAVEHERPERSDQDPEHEADIEVQEACNQCGRMARAFDCGMCHEGESSMEGNIEK